MLENYDGENYAGKDIEKIDQILKGEDIKQEKFFSKSYATITCAGDHVMILGTNKRSCLLIC